MGDQGFGIDPQIVLRIASEIKDVHNLGVQVAIVIGGGNIFRGIKQQSTNMLFFIAGLPRENDIEITKSRHRYRNTSTVTKRRKRGALFYASRLTAEPAEGVEDVHFHPLEPRSVRASVTMLWK
jgi:hypothetical protein